MHYTVVELFILKNAIKVIHCRFGSIFFPDSVSFQISGTTTTIIFKFKLNCHGE